MLATYQATWENNQIHWIDTPPPANVKLELAITVLPIQQTAPVKTKRQMPEILKGCGQEKGDILDTDELNSDWTPFA